MKYTFLFDRNRLNIGRRIYMGDIWNKYHHSSHNQVPAGSAVCHHFCETNLSHLLWSQEAVTFTQWDRKYGSVFQINTMLHPNKYASNRHAIFHTNTWFLSTVWKQDRILWSGYNGGIRLLLCYLHLASKNTKDPKALFVYCKNYWNCSRSRIGYEREQVLRNLLA